MIFKNWARKNWRVWYLSYAFIYLPWFFLLESVVTMNHPRIHVMHMFLDDLIPFCEYFIIPYYIWFFYIAVSCLYMYLKANDEEYKRFAWSLIIGMSASMIICMIYPNCVTMRPEATSGHGICAMLVEKLWATDTSTNVFPSIHVYNSLAIHLGLTKCESFAKNRKLCMASLVTCISICLSTVFLKQHSVMDVMGAFLLISLVRYFLYIPSEERRFSFRKA